VVLLIFTCAHSFLADFSRAWVVTRIGNYWTCWNKLLQATRNMTVCTITWDSPYVWSRLHISAPSLCITTYATLHCSRCYLTLLLLFPFTFLTLSLLTSSLFHYVLHSDFVSRSSLYSLGSSPFIVVTQAVLVLFSITGTLYTLHIFLLQIFIQHFDRLRYFSRADLACNTVTPSWLAER
jgi:hypothetical protein